VPSLSTAKPTIGRTSPPVFLVAPTRLAARYAILSNQLPFLPLSSHPSNSHLLSQRWLHSLSPSLKKSAWSPAEDRRLLELYAVYGPKWSQIARHIPGRTDDACSKRYREALDPSLKKDEWSPTEDERLRQAHARLGTRWGHISQELNRSSLSCRNRQAILRRSSPFPIVLTSLF
jgi:hypothetical protein